MAENLASAIVALEADIKGLVKVLDEAVRQSGVKGEQAGKAYSSGFSKFNFGGLASRQGKSGDGLFADAGRNFRDVLGPAQNVAAQAAKNHAERAGQVGQNLQRVAQASQIVSRGFISELIPGGEAVGFMFVRMYGILRTLNPAIVGIGLAATAAAIAFGVYLKRIEEARIFTMELNEAVRERNAAAFEAIIHKALVARENVKSLREEIRGLSFADPAKYVKGFQFVFAFVEESRAREQAGRAAIANQRELVAKAIKEEATLNIERAKFAQQAAAFEQGRVTSSKEVTAQLKIQLQAIQDEADETKIAREEDRAHERDVLQREAAALQPGTLAQRQKIEELNRLNRKFANEDKLTAEKVNQTKKETVTAAEVAYKQDQDFAAQQRQNLLAITELENQRAQARVQQEVQLRALTAETETARLEVERQGTVETLKLLRESLSARVDAAEKERAISRESILSPQARLEDEEKFSQAFRQLAEERARTEQDFSSRLAQNQVQSRQAQLRQEDATFEHLRGLGQRSLSDVINYYSRVNSLAGISRDTRLAAEKQVFDATRALQEQSAGLVKTEVAAVFEFLRQRGVDTSRGISGTMFNQGLVGVQNERQRILERFQGGENRGERFGQDQIIQLLQLNEQFQATARARLQTGPNVFQQAIQFGPDVQQGLHGLSQGADSASQTIRSLVLAAESLTGRFGNMAVAASAFVEAVNLIRESAASMARGGGSSNPNSTNGARVSESFDQPSEKYAKPLYYESGRGPVLPNLPGFTPGGGG